MCAEENGLNRDCLVKPNCSGLVGKALRWQIAKKRHWHVWISIVERSHILILLNPLPLHLFEAILCKSEIKLKIWRVLTTCCAKGSPASCWETVPTFITGFPSVTAPAAKHYNQHHFLHRGSLSQPNGASCVALLLVGHSFTPSRQQRYNKSTAHV